MRLFYPSRSLKIGLMASLVLTVFSLRAQAQAISHHPAAYSAQSEHEQPIRRTGHREANYRQGHRYNQRPEHHRRRSYERHNRPVHEQRH